MRRAEVYYRDVKAGRLVEDENGYLFCYDATYLASENAEPISLTLPCFRFSTDSSPKVGCLTSPPGTGNSTPTTAWDC